MIRTRSGSHWSDHGPRYTVDEGRSRIGCLVLKTQGLKSVLDPVQQPSISWRLTPRGPSLQRETTLVDINPRVSHARLSPMVYADQFVGSRSCMSLPMGLSDSLIPTSQTPQSLSYAPVKD